MRKANSNLKSAGTDVPDDSIQPNKVYLRFLPKNEDEWQLLKKDTNIVLFDYPLDYEIKVSGTYYHDPGISNSSITWQYTVIPIDYPIPNVAHEVLYEVYIPPVDSSSEVSKLANSNLSYSYYEDLLSESFRLTGNYNAQASNSSRLLKINRWNPAGTIKVYDHVVNRLIPLQGARVHARWSTNVATSITDANGYFRMGSFIFEVKYAIKWESDDYDIRNGNLLQAWYNGPKKKGDWNLEISTGGESIMYATIHRSAYKHFYGDNLGIRRPSLMDGSKTKICYIDKYGTGIFWGDWSTGGVLPDIRIWGKNENNNYWKTNIIFGYTAHELGHQAHSQYMGNIQFWQTSKIIHESWAQAVEWALTNDEYHILGNKYGSLNAQKYNHLGGFQSWMKSQDDWEYSPIFVDLMDTFNQRNSGYNSGIWHYGSTDYPKDTISGYTLSYLHDYILKKSYGLSSLREAIKRNKSAGITDADVDDLFALYW